MAIHPKVVKPKVDDERPILAWANANIIRCPFNNYARCIRGSCACWNADKDMWGFKGECDNGKV